MSDDARILAVPASDREAFALCLALGTLEAIHSGAWPTDAATWTVARPGFHTPLESAGIPDEVLAIFRGADELSALERLDGRQAVEAKLAGWIEVLKAHLAALAERSWYARWE